MTARSTSSAGSTLDAPAPPTPAAQSAAGPATMSVTTNLADDAIMATEMLVKAGAGSTALFANPFVEEREELLFVDITGSLQWLTHNGSDGGWLTVGLTTREGAPATADEVAIAVHVDGSVWAFALDEHHRRSWTLSQSPGGEVTWVCRDETPVKDARGLQVQYLPERPARPIIHHLHDHAGMLTLQSLVAMEAPADLDQWFAYDSVRGVPAKLFPVGGAAYYGLDSPKGTARLYTIDDDGTLWYLYGDRNSLTTKSIGRADELAGLWHSPAGLGCVALHPYGQYRTIATVWPAGGDGVHTVNTLLDVQLRETSLWEDGSGLYHLYGLVDGVLRVVHQKGLHFYDEELPVPAWETLPVTVDGTDVEIAISRALTGSVDMYAVDAFPDEYPSQHVMHVPGSVEAAERCVIMTQDVATSWWSREVVRLPAGKKPYKVRMHESRLTLHSGSGAIVSDCPVTITSDRAADVRIGGAFYRCGPEHPVKVTTDHAGTLRLGTVAKDLIGCNFHVTGVGLPDGTSFNPVTNLHSFLGGAGELPSFPGGITKERLQDAKTSDDRWVFPAWHGTTSAATYPGPEQVLTYCRQAYQATAKPPVVTTADGQSVPLRRTVLQTWDPSRPAFEEITTAERQAEVEAAIAARADDWDPDSIGDVFLAIGEGLATVVETGVNWIAGTATIVVKWVGDELLHLKLLWDQSENPFQFIQAVFNELESDVEDVLDWLNWVFDWDDIMSTADALRDGIRQLPQVINPQLDYVRDEVVGTWFAQKKDDVHDFFTKAKLQFGDQTFSPTPRPVPSRVPLNGAKNPPASVVDPQKGLGPKTNWMLDWMRDHADGDFMADLDQDSIPKEFFEAVTAFEELLTVFEDEKVGQDLSAAIEDLERLVTNVFDVSDLQSLARTEIVTFLDMIEHLVEMVLDLADAIVHKALTLIEKVIACLPAFLELDFLKDSFVGWLWEFICEEAGIEVTLPSLGDMFITAIAFLLTTVSKAVTGDVPFPGGFPDLVSSLERRPRATEPGEWFPSQPEHWGPEEYDIGPVHQARIQAMVGVFQMFFTGIDLYMDSKNVAGSNEPPETSGEELFIGAITTFDLIAFGLLDMPVFWGCNWMTAEEVPAPDEGMWWGEYICKMVIYCGDIVVAGLYPLCTGQPKFRNILGTMQGNFGNIMITVLGWIEFGFSIALCVLDEGTLMAWIWLISQFLSMLSSMTAFMRILPAFQADPEFRGLKIGADVFGDMSAGFWYLVMGALEADRIPKPATFSWKTDVTAGSDFVGILQAYDTHSLQEAGELTFEPPAWRFDDSEQAPEWLSFVDYGPKNPFNSLVKVIGTVPQSAIGKEYAFDVRVTNGYDPNISSALTLRLKVTG